jgi:rod shape-determining protein MreD
MPDQQTITTESMRAARVRVRVVPVLATMLASLATILPMIATAPLMPPAGFVMLLAWRLLRPELWPVWIGIPLGLFDDIFSGQPIGTAMSLWTLTLLIFDLIDSYVIWRDYWIDWLLAAIAIALYILVGYWFSGMRGSPMELNVLLPQILISILVFPLFVRICVRLDRWRLPL